MAPSPFPSDSGEGTEFFGILYAISYLIDCNFLYIYIIDMIHRELNKPINTYVFDLVTQYLQ